MNKSIKILLLAIAMTIAIGGTLFFIKTIVSPPGPITFSNQFESAFNDHFNNFKNGSPSNLESDFKSITDLAERFKEESVIDDKTFDKNYIDIIGVYAPKFASYCLDQFQKSEWNEKDHSFMIDRINQLRNLTNTAGSLKLMDNYPQQDQTFTLIISTINKYKNAKSLATKTTFISIEDSKSKISKARDYKNDTYLRNNVSLVNALNKLPYRLEESHYKSLSNKIHSLAHFRSLSYDEFLQKGKNTYDAINNYKNNAHDTYGISESEVNSRFSALNKELTRIANEADEYFDYY